MPIGTVLQATVNKLREGAPIQFGLGVRGQAAVAAIDDRKVEFLENFDLTAGVWRFISVSFV